MQHICITSEELDLMFWRVVDFMPALSIAVSQYLRSKEGPDVVHDHEEIP